MMKDLEAIHEKVLEAYKAVMLLSGIDLDKLTMDALPTRHVPL